MLKALVAGERDPEVLAEMAKRKLRSKIPKLREAMHGRFTEHHALLIGVSLDHLEHLEAAIARLDTRVDERIAPFVEARDNSTPSPGSASRPPSRSSRRSVST